MTVDIIIAGILAVAPAITAIFGIIAAFIKIKNNNAKSVAAFNKSFKEIIEEVIKIKNNNAESVAVLNKSFKEVKEEVIKTKEYESLKDELKLAHQENRELKKLINELLTKQDKVVRED